jgi:hypothetical protein
VIKIQHDKGEGIAIAYGMGELLLAHLHKGAPVVEACEFIGTSREFCLRLCRPSFLFGHLAIGDVGGDLHTEQMAIDPPANERSVQY